MMKLKIDAYGKIEKCSIYGDMVYLADNTLIDDGCINNYNWNYKGVLFELYWNCNTNHYEIYGEHYALKNIDKKTIWSHEFSMAEIIEEAFPAFLFDGFEDDTIEDFEDFEDVDWM